MKHQSFLEQKAFVNKLVILANQTFRYIIDLKIANKSQKTEYEKNMKKLPCFHWNIQHLKLNSKIYASLIPFLPSFPKLLGLCYTLLQIYMDKFKGNVFQVSTNFFISSHILACFWKCMSKASSLVTFLKS